MAQTILLVEDDAVIGRMLVSALDNWGYRVLHAANTAEATRLAQTYRGEIDVAVCDVVLQGEAGTLAAANMRAFNPRVKLCFTSGCPMNVLLDSGIANAEALEDDSTTFLEKPFLPADLRKAIVGMLSESGTRRPVEGAFGMQFAAAALA